MNYKTLLFMIISFFAIGSGLALGPSVSLAQSDECGVKENQFSNFDLPTSPSPDVTPSPFTPDLGYDKIKDCLPVSSLENTSWETLINKFLETLNYIVGFLALFGLVISGVMYITAGGDMDKAEKARHNIVWVIIGILIYLFALYFLPAIRAIISQSLAG